MGPPSDGTSFAGYLPEASNKKEQRPEMWWTRVPQTGWRGKAARLMEKKGGLVARAGG